MPAVVTRGRDWSHWQGTPSVDTIRSWNIDFGIVKCTEGRGYSDPTFHTNFARAGRAGLVRGAYHFARPEQSSAASQARRFVNRVDPGPGDILVLDLEQSDLNQARTNDWAKAFAAEARELAPANPLWLYMGGGYASTDTGRGLAAHFDRWWFPRYRNANGPWPTDFAPGHPAGGGTTGWDMPHVWQWTDRLGGYDANVSWLTRNELAAGSAPTPEEDDMQYRVYQIDPQTVTGPADVVVRLDEDTSVALGADMQYWITVDLKVSNVVEAGHLAPYQWDPADEAVYFDGYHPEPVKIGETRIKLVQNGVVTSGRHLRLAVSGRFQITDGRVDMNYVKLQ